MDRDLNDKMTQFKKIISVVESDGNVRKRVVDMPPKKKKNLRGMQYMNIGYYLAVPLIVGIFGGNWLDNYYKTKPLFSLIFVIIGLIAAFYNLYKLFKNA